MYGLCTTKVIEHLKSEEEFCGQRMLQLVVTEGHNILKVTEVPFLAGASVGTTLSMSQIPMKTGIIS